MTRVRLTIWLFVIHGLSITSYEILEAGHTLLHSFKNSLHHHTHNDHHRVTEHDVILLSDREPEIPVLPISPSGCFFLFFENCVISLTITSSKLQRFFEATQPTSSYYRPPLVPPPIS